MISGSTKVKIRRLKNEIQYHDYRYYVLNDPIITDFEYDKLYGKLVELEKVHPELVTPDSPTQRVGGKPLDSFQTIQHTVKMLSLDNTYNEDEVKEFFKRVKKSLGKQPHYEVTLKVDGVAVAISYRKGFLTQGATRGDGLQGDVITQNLKTIRSVPLTLLANIRELKDIDIRGEVYFSKRAFDQLNQDRERAGEAQFANPRNAAAGTLKLLDPQEVARRNLDIFIHTIPTQPGRRFHSHFASLQQLSKAGLKIIPHIALCNNDAQVLEEITRWRDERTGLDYEVDGLVIKVDEFAYRKILGSTIKSPRWAIAFKYPAMQAITRLVSIQLQVGRTGRVTPVAVLDPVNLSGSTVSRATLHNEDEIERKCIMINDQVVIEKGGEIIPKVIGVVKARRTGKEIPFKFSKKCPGCAQPIIRLPDEADWRCVNASCPAQIKGSILHFASRTAMDIEGFGFVLVDKLVDSGYITNLDDIYTLSISRLMNIDRIGEKSADNLVKAIERSKNKEFRRVLYALGIPNVGINASNLLVDEFNTIDQIMNAHPDKLSAIPGIGEIIAQSITKYFTNKKNVAMIENLRKHGLQLQEKRRTSKDMKLQRKIFVFTGELKHVTRSEAQERVRVMGGHASASISGKTDYVVVGQKPGSKLKKAKRLGVKIISENEFMELTKRG